MGFNFFKNKKSQYQDDVVWSEPKEGNIEKETVSKGFFDFKKNNSLDSVDLKKSRKKMLRDIKNENQDNKISTSDNKKVSKKNIKEKTLNKSVNLAQVKPVKDNKHDAVSFFNFDFFDKYLTKYKKYLTKYKKYRKDFYKTRDVEKFDTEKEEKNKDDKLEKKDVKKWEQVDTLNTNLIKGQIYINFDWQRNVIYLVIGVLFSSIILSGAYFSTSYIYESQDNNTKEYAEEIKEIKIKIVEAEKEIKKIKSFGAKIKLVKETLDKHIYWTDFFDFMEKNTLPNVYFADFSGSTDGVYNLSATTKDFDTLYAQILHLKNNANVLEVKTESGNRAIDSETDESEVSFSLNIKLNSNIFYQ